MSESKHIAIFGGSFDPPHIGHRRLVEFYLNEFPDTSILHIVPNRLSPLKDKKYFSSEEIIKLCELNFKDIDPNRINIFNYELNKDTPSYTYETILECKKLYPNYSVDLILGEDQFSIIPSWEKFEIILQEIDRFVIFRRITDNPDKVHIPKVLNANKIHILNNPIWDESSTQWKHWPNQDIIHKPVLVAMKEFSIHQFNPISLQKWIEVAKEHITDARIDHILKVSNIAKELSIAHNYPFPEKMELAGILHDLTKQKNREFHINVFKQHGFEDYYNFPAQVYHAISAYFIIQENGIHDIDILNSVKSHSLGKSNMSLAETILYTADYLGSEYARRDPNYNMWCNHIYENLAIGVYLKSKNTIIDLITNNKTIHNLTLEAYNSSVQYINLE